MNIYLDNGYLDITRILELGLPFNFIVHARGTGKTYGALQHVLEHDVPFIYMRRLQSQCDAVLTPEYNPFKKLNSDTGREVRVKRISKNNCMFYEEREEGPVKMGTTCALSTVASLRGFDASEVKIILYDEFIPEPQERTIREEATAFFNAYETINRNRELDGEPPVQALLMGNSDNMANPIFMELGLVNRAMKMKESMQEVYIDRQRGICLIIPASSAISDKKRQTALYRLTENSEFAAMALDNQFVGDHPTNNRSRPLRQYRPIVAVGEICLYKEKNGGRYYVSPHISGSPQRYKTTDKDLMAFRRYYSWSWLDYLDGCIDFETYACEVLYKKFMGY